MLVKGGTSHGHRDDAWSPRRNASMMGPAGAVVIAIFTLVALSGDVHAGGGAVSLTALISGLAAVACWTLVLLYDRVPSLALSAATIFLFFIAWMLCLLVIDGVNKAGIQFILVQVAFAGALLLTATARHVIGPYLDVVVARCIRLTAIVIMIAEVAGTIDAKFAFNVRPLAIVALSGLGWFLAEYRTGRRTSLRWAFAVFFCIAITLSRTATLAGFVIIVITMLSGSERHRARNAALAALMLVGGFVAVTSWAPLRDRFTQGDTSLSVGGVSINAEGRTRIWVVLFPEARRDPIIGRGPGAASARSLEVSGDLDHPHNDYLGVFYDFGLIGVGLLAWFGIRSARLLRRVRKRWPRLVAPRAALNVGLAILIVMVTDNPLDYSFVMIPLGALIGLGLGYVVRTSREASAYVA